MKIVKKADLILLGILIAAVLLTTVMFSWKKKTGTGRTAVLSLSDQEIRIPLDGSGTLEFSNNGINIHIETEAGKARFVRSECPDHICEHYGWVREEGDTAVCLPAKAILYIR